MAYKKVYKKRAQKKRAPKKSNKMLVSVINKVIRRKAETKFIGTQALEESVNSNVQAVIHSDISQIASGTTNSERIGDKISPFGIWLSYILHNNSAVPIYCRVVLAEVNDGAFTSIGSNWLMDAVGDPQALTAERLSDINFTLNKHEFKVLYDKVHRIAGLGDGTGIETIMRKKLIKLRGSRTFQDGTSADSKLRNVRLLTICRGADNDTANNVVEMTYSTKYYFKDY